GSSSSNMRQSMYRITHDNVDNSENDYNVENNSSLIIDNCSLVFLLPRDLQNQSRQTNSENNDNIENAEN
ncbi:MAG: hypothetical protein K2H01_05995, partial [Ruminococcus sp.]|nr:hypothetical protein [Ruminococcus sp.]